MEKSVGKTSYPSDLNDAEWAILDPLIPRARQPGCTILNAIFYLVRSGCAWRMLPNDLPPWKLVWHYFSHGPTSPHAAAPQHFLYFLPLPQEHGSLRPIFGVSRRTVCVTGACCPV
jgi:transposase